MAVEPPIPLAIIMITLNEAHNMVPVLENVCGWAKEIIILDSYSSDSTVDIGLRYGAMVYQRAFKGFGEQWNFAVRRLPIASPWTMKLDPDERISEELKRSISAAVRREDVDGLAVTRQLWFLGRPLPIRQNLLRLWRTGACTFSDVLVNEHPIVNGRIVQVSGDLEHHDSPNMHHWWDKQNRYTTAEAIGAFRGTQLSATPRFLGSPLQHRMWLKAYWHRVPLRYVLLFSYNYFYSGAWRAGYPGYIWARSRVEVHRLIEIKLYEMRIVGREYELGSGPRGGGLTRGCLKSRNEGFETGHENGRVVSSPHGAMVARRPG